MQKPSRPCKRGQWTLNRDNDGDDHSPSVFMLMFRTHLTGQRYWHTSEAPSCRTISQRSLKMILRRSLSLNMWTRFQRRSRYVPFAKLLLFCQLQLIDKRLLQNRMLVCANYLASSCCSSSWISETLSFAEHLRLFDLVMQVTLWNFSAI